MSSQSLLIIFRYPPQVRVQDTLLEDHVWTEIEGVPVFAGVPPWNPMHDLLVDRETKTLAGIVYPVMAEEHAAIAAICESLPRDVVRYCISPVSAAALLRNLETELSGEGNGFWLGGETQVPIGDSDRDFRAGGANERSGESGGEEVAACHDAPIVARSPAGYGVIVYI